MYINVGSIKTILTKSSWTT